MNSNAESPSTKLSARKVWLAAVAIFFIAFGVRLLMLHDSQVEARRVQSSVAADYQKTAQLLKKSGVPKFFDSNGPLADPNLLGHPPGYPIVRALVGGVFGDSNRAIQLFQITCDAIAAVVVLLITLELLSFATAVVSGILVALAPQFVWNSVLLLRHAFGFPTAGCDPLVDSCDTTTATCDVCLGGCADWCFLLVACQHVTFSAFRCLCSGNSIATERPRSLCSHDSGERSPGDRHSHCA